MKLRHILPGAALALAIPAYAGFTPIAINPSSYNHDPVVEKTAPLCLNEAVTVTTDGGTNKNGNTFYEQGYNPAAPTTGLPVAGSLLTATNTTTSRVYTYQMAPSYKANNVIMVGHNNGGHTPLVGPATFALTTPKAYTSVSFLTCSGNGAVNVGYRIHFADASAEEGQFSSTDWFNNAANVHNCAGRVSLAGGVQNVGGNPAGALFAADISLGNSSANISSVEFWFISGSGGNLYNNGRAFIFAVAGSTDDVNFSPIAVTGYNHDAVVEADGPQTTGTGLADAGALTNNVTASMDGGVTEGGSTWYEKGYYASLPNTGIPPAGSTITSAWYSAVYTMPSDYTANCAVFLPKTSSASISLASPASYGALSLLCGAGGGNSFLPYVISFVDGTTESGTLYVPDWHNRELPYAYCSFGRVAPASRTANNTADQFVDPFSTPTYPYQFEFRGLALPVPRLFDAVIPLANTASAVTNISLTFTNTGDNRNVSVFAVSGAAPGNVPPIFGARGSAVPGMPANAPINSVQQVKVWEGTNNVVLAVTNIAGSSVSYQWKKAPRGGGLKDIMYSFDYGTFANVVDGGRVSGANSSVLVISNALVADSADYVCVASNPSGAANSTVATVLVLSTNQSLLSGVPAGDVLISPAGDIQAGASPGAEATEHAFDRVIQKWLTDGLQWGGACCGGPLPFTGPVGFGVTPVLGRSVVTGMRFYTANDATARDPMDYGLEGSTDGGNTWSYITGGKLIGTLSLPTGRNVTGTGVPTPLAVVPGPALTNMVEVNFANNVAYGSYRITITNVTSRLQSQLMQIGEIELLGTLVSAPPVWVRQPEPSSTVYAGASPVFVALATGEPTPTYQWYKGSTLIPGATSSAYTFPNAQPGDSGTTFRCDAINRVGTISSTFATLNVIAAPTQPYPVAVLADAPLGYWRLNEGPDNAAGNNGLLALDYRGAHNGSYSNVTLQVDGYNQVADADKGASFGTFTTPNSYVANIRDVDFAQPAGGAGRAFSIEAWVAGGPQASDAAILTKGYSGILTAGTGTGTEQFVLDVTGATFRTFRFFVRDAAGNAAVALSPVIHYDTNSLAAVWHHLVGVCDQPNGKVYLFVDGLLAASGDIDPNVGIQAQPMPMTIGARKQNDAAEYNQQWTGIIDDVAVYGAALSPSQVLNHFYAGHYPPIITLQPTNAVTIAENVTLTVPTFSYGSGTLGYQWYLSDGTSPTTRVTGQTASNLVMTTAVAQSGNYQLVVTNNYGAVTSSVMQLSVVGGAPSYIVDLPTTSPVGLGHVLKLEVQPGGTGPFTYQWKKDGVNLADNYRISGSQSSVLYIGYATNADAGSYQVVLHNAQGDTPSTATVVSIVAGSSLPPFTAAGTGWTLNGTTPPIMAANRLEMTSGANDTTRSAWANDKINVGAFSASFIYTVTSGAGGADGVTFCLQNVGLNALGGGGGAMGYGTLANSFAVAFNIYNGNAANPRGINVLTGGTVSTPFFPIDPVLVGGNANPIQVNLNYSGGVLAATFKDTVTAATYTTNVTVNIPTAVGAGTAYVGFTAATGGVNSTQVITDFSMAGQPFAVKSRSEGGKLVLSWAATAGAFLETTPSLTNPVWTPDTTSTFRVVGNEAQVTVTPSASNQFYRLRIMP